MDNAKGLDVVMPMYNLIEYNDNYAKTSGNVWQYHKDDSNITWKIPNHSKLKQE